LSWPTHPGSSAYSLSFAVSNPGCSISVGLPLDSSAASRALELTGAGVDVLHFYAEDNGREGKLF